MTALAYGLQAIEIVSVGRPWLEALVFAILLGVAIRSVWTPPGFWHAGIAFSAKRLLEIAVVLLGASVSVRAVLAIGPALIAGIAIVVVVAIATSYAISRALGLKQRMAILVACGNSICGNSAIAAVAPIVGADGEDVASSIAFTAVLGVIVVLTLPLLVPLLQMSLTQYGVMAGLTVYAVPQVLAATLPIGALSNQVGTVVKLVRVLMLGPVVLLMSVLASRLRDETDEPAPEVTAGDRPAPGRPPLHQLVPWFIVGFLVVAGLRTAGSDPEPGAAADRTRRQPPDDGLDGGSRPWRRYKGGGEGRATGDGGRHFVAHRPRIAQPRPHPSHRRCVIRFAAIRRQRSRSASRGFGLMITRSPSAALGL